MSAPLRRVPSPTGSRSARVIATIWPYARLAVAALLLVAVAMQFQRTVSVYAAMPEPYASHVPTLVANFFSYFTNLANIATAATLIAGAVWALTRGRSAKHEPRWLAVALVCTTSCMVVTGVVYNALLRDTADPLTFLRFSNEVVHVVGPLFLLADLLLAPKRRTLAWRSIWVVVAIPIAWCAYTLVRAPFIIEPSTGFTGFYPYPFLNPRVQDGFAGVAAYIAVLSVVVAAVAVAVIAVSRARAHRADAESDPDAAERGGP
ncbi:MAG: Pr6Pr family membrane protein [Microbacteriaceae bacterium]